MYQRTRRNLTIRYFLRNLMILMNQKNRQHPIVQKNQMNH
jgi:hypothetical protein